MNINDQFESKYLKSSDLQGRTVKVKISSVTSEQVGNDQSTKMVLYFAGKQKGMICNRTNAMTIAEVWGPETDNWTGGEIELFSMKVPFQGKLTDGLRVRPIVVRARRQAPAQPPQDDWQAPATAPRETAGTTYDAIDDEIPF